MRWRNLTGFISSSGHDELCRVPFADFTSKFDEKCLFFFTLASTGMAAFSLIVSYCTERNFVPSFLVVAIQLAQL